MAKVDSQDSLAWNYVRVMKERSEHDLSTGTQMVANPEELFDEQQYPILWSALYLLMFVLLARFNMRNYLDFAKN